MKSSTLERKAIHMKVTVCKNYDEISAEAAKIIADQISENPECTLGLATGSTPVGTYKKLIEMYENGELDFSKVKSFNLDEYYPISPDNDQSYYYFMDKNLFSKVNINKDNTHIPNGNCKNPEEECEMYDKLIDNSGGIDLQILGIGQNGHIGFNEPSSTLVSKTHLTALTESTIKANSRFFESESDVPTHALTMGIGSILKAKKIIILASGTEKHAAVKELIEGGISTKNPATMLNLHPDVTLICDEQVLKSTRIGVDLGGTEMKIGVVDDNNNIIKKITAPTPQKASAAEICDEIARNCKILMEDYNVSNIGIGTPGLIRNSKVSAVNLSFDNLALADEIKARTGLPTKIGNDANCAALAESREGAGKGFDNCIMLTLGTGIGGGIIIDGKLYEGSGSAGEIGHICLESKGVKCNCGLTGCFENYASATALMKYANAEADAAPGSILAKKREENGGKINGIVLFGAIRENCPAAQKALNTFTDYLSAGINGLIYVFDPDMIIISGGISNAGDLLLEPLKAKIPFDIPVKIATMKNDAGILGASML